MAETLGSLCDKLAIMNLKLWHLEDIKHDPNSNDEKVADVARKIAIANKQRNALIEEIDEMASKGKFPVYKQLKLY